MAYEGFVHMKRTIGLALAASLLSAGGLAGIQVPDSLTVEQAIQRVIATHPAVVEAGNGVSASEARVRERQSAFTPVVTAEGSYARVGPVPSLTLNNEAFSLFPANNYDAHFSLYHTVYDWGRRQTAVEQAQTYRRSAAENVDLVKSGLAYQTAQAFYAVLFLQQNLIVQDDEISTLGQHLQVIQDKVKAGTATDFDVLTTQVRIATARSQRVDLANALDERTIELRELLGLPADSMVEPVGAFEVDSTSLAVDSLVAAALAQRPEVKLSRDAEASAKVQTQLAALADRPSLGLALSAGAKNGYVPKLNKFQPNFSAGMSIQLPIYNGDRTRSQVRVSEAEESVARSRTQTLVRRVTTDVEKAVASVRASREKIQTADLQVRQATQALDLAQTRYQAGVVTNLDVLDAETLLAQAKLVQLRARYELVQGRYRLEQAVGDRIW